MAEREGVQRPFTAGEKWSVLFLVFIVGLACLQSCGGDDGGSRGADADVSAPLLSAEADDGEHQLAVASAEFREWPFTVPAGLLRCRMGVQVTFEGPGGTEYGVNGTAQDAGYPSVLPIWALDLALGHGLRVDISEVLNKAPQSVLNADDVFGLGFSPKASRHVRCCSPSPGPRGSRCLGPCPNAWQW